MDAAFYELPQADWPYSKILMRIALGLALGLLIGLERERRRKEAGLRTFGFIALLGTMGGALGPAFALLALALTGALALLLNWSSLRSEHGSELTTAAAMMVTAMAGVMCGVGHTLTPAAVMIIATALLAWKERLSDFSMGMSEGEVRSAILLAILAIVIYPALPVGAVGPWGLVEPRAAWITVILIAGIGFFNYVLWKLYGARGAEISGFFGGLVNSNFTVIEMATRARQLGEPFAGTAYRSIVLATSAMLARNGTLLLLLAPAALSGALLPLLFMFGMAALLVAAGQVARRASATPAPAMQMEMPFSLRQALKYGLIFLMLHIVGGLMQRQFGDAGFYAVSVLGGLLSSASAVAAAATLATQGAVEPTVAGIGAVLASFTSMAFSLSFVLRSGSRALVRRMATAVCLIAAAGAVGMALDRPLASWVESLTGGLSRMALPRPGAQPPAAGPGDAPGPAGADVLRTR